MSKDLGFRSLRPQNWMNFARVDTDIQNRVFLVGPNAPGKSNLLDVFRFLRDLAHLALGKKTGEKLLRGTRAPPPIRKTRVQNALSEVQTRHGPESRHPLYS